MFLLPVKPTQPVLLLLLLVFLFGLHPAVALDKVYPIQGALQVLSCHS